MASRSFAVCSQLLEPYKCHICDFSTDFCVAYHEHFRKCCMDSKQDLCQLITQSDINFRQESPQMKTVTAAKKVESVKSESISFCSQLLEPYKCAICNFFADFYVDYKQHLVQCRNDSPQQHLNQTAAPLATREIENIATTAREQIKFPPSRQEFKRRAKEKQTVKEQLFYCQKCDYSAATKFRLHYLVNSTHKNPSMQCDKCDFKTSTKSHLKSHLLFKHTVHDEIKWFECHNCDYKSKFKNSLKIHIISKHTLDGQIKWYECDLCDFKAKQKGNLKQHSIYVHSVVDQVKWHECDSCDYRTKQEMKLKRHFTYEHTSNEKIKWHECDQCDFKTKEKGNLQKHLFYLHAPSGQIKRYECEKCNFKTKRTGDLKKHMIVHTPCDHIKWFQRDQCECKYKRLKDHRKHIRRVHSK